MPELTEQEQRAAEEKLRAAVTEALTHLTAGDVQWFVEDQLDREDMAADA